MPSPDHPGYLISFRLRRWLRRLLTQSRRRPQAFSAPGPKPPPARRRTIPSVRPPRRPRRRYPFRYPSRAARQKRMRRCGRRLR